MSDNSKIEWTDATWNPVVGCSPVSAGCANCYAISAVKRVGEFQGEGSKYRDLTVVQKNGVRGWSGNVELFPERLEQPLKWKRGRKIFVNSLSDLWHEDVPFEFVDKIFAVMALSPQHSFQVLTKRPERAAAYFSDTKVRERIAESKFVVSDAAGYDAASTRCRNLYERSYRPARQENPDWPLPNVWIGVSVEDQKAADERIPILLQIPAAIRFLSCEPLLGPVDLTGYCGFDAGDKRGHLSNIERIDWVIVGGESGHKARPMAPEWAVSLHKQCKAAGVPFFFKQWGEWSGGINHAPRVVQATRDKDGNLTGFSWSLQKVGKKEAGRMMLGEYWNEFPVQKQKDFGETA